ncbi:MAG: hypothetical protein D6798_00700 [Deltaproteobacteria bacterium]|nr:MAG: hypothetical protein D6798_00700 [Deltaproteobacteria bacterium]
MRDARAGDGRADYAPFVVLALLLLPAAQAADFDSLLSADGWEVAGSVDHEVLGAVTLAVKDVSGVRCLRGTARVDASARDMLGVVDDIDGARSWSTAGLSESRVLERRDGHVDYVQVLDVPDWTMAADRFWVLRSRTTTAPDGALVFRWDRFDWRAAWPELAAELAARHPRAVEPDPNFGAWVFRERPVAPAASSAGPAGGQAVDAAGGDAGTELAYYLCTESGSLPAWLQKAAATRTVPAAMADVVRAARRRAH